MSSPSTPPISLQTVMSPCRYRQYKRPFMKGWQRYRFQEGDESRYVYEGCGLLTRFAPAADIDVWHEVLAAKLEMLALTILGAAPIRYGQAPKRALLYRTCTPFKKLRSREYRHSSDPAEAKPHAVEFLGDGQQIVAYAAQSPVTRRPYRRNDASHPLTVRHADLTEIGAEAAARFLREADALIAAEPGFAPVSPQALSIQEAAQAETSDELTARDVQQCRDALRAIPNDDVPYDAWALMLCAVKGALGAEGEEDFRAWSAKSSKHKDDWTRVEYQRCHPERIGAGTIYYLARKAVDGGPKMSASLTRKKPASRSRSHWPSRNSSSPAIRRSAQLVELRAEGGAGKTTFCLWEAVHIALGRPLFGAEVVKPGAVLFITAEDDKAILAYRIQAVAAALRLTEAENKVTLAEPVFIEDVSGRILRLVQADERGNLAVTEVGERLIEAYRDRGLVLINIDPTNLFGPGERYVNDAEAALMCEGLRIARKLNCTVRYVHHIGKSNALGADVHQYLGRGGSAFADNSRFQHFLGATIPPSRYELPTLGSTVETDELKRAAEGGRVLRLHMTSSWGGKAGGAAMAGARGAGRVQGAYRAADLAGRPTRTAGKRGRAPRGGGIRPAVRCPRPTPQPIPTGGQSLCGHGFDPAQARRLIDKRLATGALLKGLIGRGAPGPAPRLCGCRLSGFAVMDALFRHPAVFSRIAPGAIRKLGGSGGAITPRFLPYRGRA